MTRRLLLQLLKELDMNTYYVYILANQYHTVLYIGVTNNLERRVAEHKAGIQEGFTKKYSVNKLVYFETSPSITAAIEREKQFKAGSRAKKLALIKEQNPTWQDLMANY
jgi:putative endonuclease